jgi:hypothetical protein
LANLQGPADAEPFLCIKETLGIDSSGGDLERLPNHRRRGGAKGHVEGVLNDLETRNTTEPHNRLRRFIGYLINFEDAVDCNHFNELGYPVGIRCNDGFKIMGKNGTPFKVSAKNHKRYG